MIMSAAGTNVNSSLPTTAIVTSGPFRISRNPLYLALNLLFLGLTLALMALVVVPREERYLAARFPSAYPPYQREVRRWL